MAWPRGHHHHYDYHHVEPVPVVLDAPRPRFRRRMVSENFYGGIPYQQPVHALAPWEDDLALHRSRSTGHGIPAHHAPPPPINITNHIQQEEMPVVRGRELAINHAYHHHCGEASGGRSRSAHRSRSRRREHDESPHRTWQQERDNEQMRLELEAYKREKERIEEAKRVEAELLLKKAREEQKQREEEDRRKRIEEQAIADFQQKEQARLLKERLDKEKAEKEREEIEKKAILDWQMKEREKKDKEKEEQLKREEEYKNRLKKDFNLTDSQVAKVLARDQAQENTALDTKRKTYTKIARKHISIETLRAYDLPYKLDDVCLPFNFEPLLHRFEANETNDAQHDPEGYVLVKRWVPENLQERLWEHTRRVRASRRMIEIDQERHLITEIKQKKKQVRAKSPGLFGGRW